MDKRKIETGIVAVVVFSAFMTLFAISIVQASPSIIYVPDNYTLIQDAVRAASPGDTIIVREVTYNENMEVDKPLTIRSKNGPDSTTIRAEYPDDPVFEITADYVNISGFTVTGAYEDAGIDIRDVKYCNISNNICTNNEKGIYIFLSNNNSISNNNCSYNTMAGIILGGSSNNSISNNKCLSNINVSIYIVSHSCSNSVSSNTCSDSQMGILLATAANNNSISKNTCSNNEIGIYPSFDSNNNIFYLNNFINNIENAFSLESTNMWNSISEISYTYNETAYQNYLGNYWDDYNRSDKNNDGIGDRSYHIDGDRDRFPMMKPWENYFS